MKVLGFAALTVALVTACSGGGGGNSGGGTLAAAQAWLPTHAECLAPMTLTQYFQNENRLGPVVYDATTYAGTLQRAKDYQTMGLVTSKRTSGFNSGDEQVTGVAYTPTDAGKSYVHVFNEPGTNRGSSIQPCFAIVNDLAVSKTTTAESDSSISLVTFSGTLAPASWVTDANKKAIADVWAMKFETFQAGIKSPDDSATPPMSGPVTFTLSMSKDASGTWQVNGFSR